VSAEVKQDYARIYRLFSVAKKKQLQQENAVKGPAYYVRLRRSSEARWFNFVEKDRRMSQGRTVVTYSVSIEENGRQEQALVNIGLLVEGGGWRIDTIEY
jgi:hypothetical protein